MKRLSRSRNSAFTLVEILAVTMLMAGLIAMAGVGIAQNVKKGKINTAKAQIGNFEHALQLFELECGAFPSAIEDLIHKPSTKCKDYPDEGFLGKKEIPLDPWNHEYHYQKPGSHNTSSFDLWSDGPKQDDEGDDITNWTSDNLD